MFGPLKIVKNVLGLKKNNSQELSENKKDDGIFSQKIDQISQFFDGLYNQALDEYKSIKEKSIDLSATNYKLGMRHMDNGNVKEAIFRFKITKKFWPDNYDAYYQLAVCLILDSQFDEAQKVLAELLEKNPNYKEKIEQLIGDSASTLNQEN